MSAALQNPSSLDETLSLSHRPVSVTVMSMMMGLVSSPLVKSYVYDEDSSVNRKTKINTGKNRGAISVSRYVWRAQINDLRWADEHELRMRGTNAIGLRKDKNSKKVRFLDTVEVIGTHADDSVFEV